MNGLDASAIMSVAAHSSMQPLFEEEGMHRLDALIRPGVLCAFDFDGTLAPLVDLPDKARLPDDMRSRLVALCAHAPVAVITGRSVSDIRKRLGFEPTYVVGNHGIEGIPGTSQGIDDFREICRAWIRQLHATIHEPGIEIEDKVYSLSVHYRNAPDPLDAEAHLRPKLAALLPVPRIVDGIYLFNVLPMHAANKGLAVERLIDACAAPGAVYVGDDVTDEDVFRLRRRDVMSIRIGRATNSAAEFFVPQRAEIVRLLDLIIEKLDMFRLPAHLKPHAISS
jgi:trehalose 6-phosphate phosphatase